MFQPFTSNLEQLAIEAVSPAAARSAFATLVSLARCGHIDAIVASTRVLSFELGYGNTILPPHRSKSIEEIVKCAEVPAILRVYAAGCVPCEFLRLVDDLSQLKQEIESSHTTFQCFKRLLSFESMAQDEMLKAYCLAVLSGMMQPSFKEVMTNRVKQKILDTIASTCRVVEGDSADHTLAFGKDFLLRLSGPTGLFTVVAHEFGHHCFDEALESQSMKQRSVMSSEIEDCIAITSILQRLLTQAGELGKKPLRPGDPRGHKFVSDVIVICTLFTNSNGAYFHFSLTAGGCAINQENAAGLAKFVLSVLDIPMEAAAIAYSPRGVFHFGFLQHSLRPSVFSRFETLDFKELAELSLAKSSDWIEELRRADRFGNSEEDICCALGLEPRRPELFASDAQITLGDLRVISVVRSYGVQPTWGDEVLNDLLRAAVRFADPSALDKLIKAGGRVTHPGPSLIQDLGSSLGVIKEPDQFIYVGPTVLDIQTSISILMGAGYDLNGPVDNEGNTLLTVARSFESAQFLCKLGLDLERRNAKGETALFRAAARGNVNIVHTLLIAGANIESQALDGCTPLHAAVANDNVPVVVHLLRSGADPKAINSKGQSILAASRSAEVVEWLCNAGAQMNLSDSSGITPLMSAAQKGLPEVLQALLHKGADVNAVTDLGTTALHYAVGAGDLESVTSLLDAGADIEAETNEGLTALFVAAQYQEDKAIELLISRGANPNCRTIKGQTPLMIATLVDVHSRNFAQMDTIVKMIQALASAGANLDAVDAEGRTAVDYGTQTLHNEPLQCLLSLGANPNSHGSDGLGPLARAVIGADVQKVSMLLDAGAYVDQVDGDGNSAMMLAILSEFSHEETRAELVSRLLGAGADLNLANKMGQTARMLAKAESDTAPWKIILSRGAKNPQNKPE
jgi:ankyrin repeat protein